MKTETVEYKDGDVTLRGYLAYDDKKSGKRPGVLVMPEADPVDVTIDPADLTRGLRSRPEIPGAGTTVRSG